MRIACLAWGSLVWDPRTLPHRPPFLEDGPALPIEFSRVSLDGRVTLVIDPSAPEIQTLWVPLEVANLDAAIEALGAREKIAPSRRAEWVGRFRLGASAPPTPLFAGIEDWLEARGLDAVVWTALPGRTPDGDLDFAAIDSLVDHLRALSGESRARAEQYVRRAPRVVRTPNRTRIESEFGWLAADAD